MPIRGNRDVARTDRHRLPADLAIHRHQSGGVQQHVATRHGIGDRHPAARPQADVPPQGRDRTLRQQVVHHQITRARIQSRSATRSQSLRADPGAGHRQQSRRTQRCARRADAARRIEGNAGRRQAVRACRPSGMAERDARPRIAGQRARHRQRAAAVESKGQRPFRQEIGRPIDLHPIARRGKADAGEARHHRARRMQGHRPGHAQAAARCAAAVGKADPAARIAIGGHRQ